MNTLNESQILTLLQETAPDIDVIGQSYCGKSIYVSWPHLMEARVVAIANKEIKYSVEMDTCGENTNAAMDGAIRKTSMTPRDVDEWKMQEKEIRTR